MAQLGVRWGIESIEIASWAQETNIRGSLIIWELQPYCYWGMCNQSSCSSCWTEASQSVLLWQCGEMLADSPSFKNQHHGQRLQCVSSCMFPTRCGLGFVFHTPQFFVLCGCTCSSHFHVWACVLRHMLKSFHPTVSCIKQIKAANIVHEKVCRILLFLKKNKNCCPWFKSF